MADDPYGIIAELMEGVPEADPGEDDIYFDKYEEKWRGFMETGEIKAENYLGGRKRMFHRSADEPDSIEAILEDLEALEEAERYGW